MTTDQPTISEYVVRGMTCDHCVAAVTREVEGVSGVRDVVVDLTSGSLRVTGVGVDPGSVRDAVDEAGYEVA